jgi:septum formation protein
MLETLRGRSHEVITAMALLNGRKKSTDCRSVTSTVSFSPISDEELEWYLDTGEWLGAAGAYKIQGLASCFISRIDGSYSGIVGLPMQEFYAMLKDNGYPYGD